MGKNETTPLLPDSLLGGFPKPNESRISETIHMWESVNWKHDVEWWSNDCSLAFQTRVVVTVTCVRVFSEDQGHHGGRERAGDGESKDRSLRRSSDSTGSGSGHD